MFKKLFRSLLVCGLLLNGTTAANSVPFADFDSEHPFAEAVEFTQREKIIQGYPDGNFRLNNEINRAEFAKIIVTSKFSPQEISGQNCFPDVQEEWFAKYVCTAARKKLLSGYPNGLFQPAQPINFAEASKIIAQVFGLKARKQPKEQKWYSDSTAALAEQKAVPISIEKYSNRLKRGELVEIVFRLKKEKKDKPSANLKNFALAPNELPRLSSCAELKERLTFAQHSQPRRLGRGGVIPEMALLEEAPPMAKSALQSEDFSKTNVQVEGVDEADLLKTDGEYFYLLTKNNSLRILSVEPLQAKAEINLNTENFQPRDILLTDEHLIILGNTRRKMNLLEGLHPSSPPPPQATATRVLLYTITDRAQPTKTRDFTVSGNYQTSRLIGTQLYLVTQSFPPYQILKRAQAELDFLPYLEVQKEKQPVQCKEIAYFPGFQTPQFILVAGLDVAKAEGEISREVLLGGSDLNIYASAQHLYLAARTPPPLTKMSQLDYWTPPPEETTIYKFKLLKGTVEFLRRGAVAGTPLNQFSLDEFEGNFRIATTENGWDSTNSQNNLFILDENLAPLGQIQGLAPGERIYSARFLGKKAFLVTFRKVDPFFVLDLSKPAKPVILGKLKIPGYSDYLHPFDEQHILGFGKSTAADAKNDDFVWAQGFKMALFDVTNPAQPIERFKTEIGDRGTESELLHNHKALLFSRERELLAFPLTIAKVPAAKLNQNPAAYGEPVFAGAMVYRLNLTTGFTERARLTHFTAEDLKKLGHYFAGPQKISRLLYVGNKLFVFSESKVSAHDLAAENLPVIQELPL